MKFFKAFGLAAFAAAAAANTVDMVSQDSTDRTVKFVPQFGSPELPELRLEGGKTVTAKFPEGWIGNWYAVRDGDKSDGNGMLGEIRFDGMNGNTFFDISAIVNPNDVHNVKILHPKESKTPVSGCQEFPCDNAYNKWDDIQTKSTTEKDLVCLIGDLSPDEERRRRHERRHPRDVLFEKL